MGSYNTIQDMSAFNQDFLIIKNNLIQYSFEHVNQDLRHDIVKGITKVDRLEFFQENNILILGN